MAFLMQRMPTIVAQERHPSARIGDIESGPHDRTVPLSHSDTGVQVGQLGQAGLGHIYGSTLLWR